MVSHLVIGRDRSPVSWCRDEDQVDSSDTFAFRGLGSFLPHDPRGGHSVSASLGGAFTLRPGRGFAVGRSQAGRRRRRRWWRRWFGEHGSSCFEAALSLALDG